MPDFTITAHFQHALTYKDAITLINEHLEQLRQAVQPQRSMPLVIRQCRVSVPDTDMSNIIYRSIRLMASGWQWSYLGGVIPYPSRLVILDIRLSKGLSIYALLYDPMLINQTKEILHHLQIATKNPSIDLLCQFPRASASSVEA